MILKDKNTSDYSACTKCVSHTGYPAHGNGKDETRGRSRHKNHSNRAGGKEERGHEVEKSQTRHN